MSEEEKDVVGKADVIKEIGIDEAWKANTKRTYDRSEENLQSLFNQTQTQLAAINQVQLQTLKNMQDSANQISKQSIRHESLAADRQWNIDEQGYQVEEVLNNQTFQNAISAAVASAVNAAMKTKTE